MLKAATENGTVRCVLEDVGDGMNGEYDPSDVGDVPLLRLTVFIRSLFDEDGEYEEAESICTRIPADTPSKVLVGICGDMFVEVVEAAETATLTPTVLRLSITDELGIFEVVSDNLLTSDI